MLLFCPECNNLIKKTFDKRDEGETIVLTCDKCKCKISYYIKYKAYSKIIEKKLDK